MIEANELRIGNWVNVPECGINAQVDIIGVKKACIDNSKIDLYIEDPSFFLESLNTIPLTEEILLKCGFEKQSSQYYIKENDNANLLLFYSAGHNTYYYFADVERRQYNSTLAILHLHQLQNLYFALTRIELEIKL